MTCDGPITETLSMTSGYSVPWPRKSNDPSFFASALEHVDEGRADDLSLLLGIGDAREPLQKQVRRVDEDERQLQSLEARPDLVRFVLPHDAVVDEDARQAIADRAVDQHRRDRRVDAAAQPAHDPALTNLRADPLASPPRTNDDIVQSPVQPQTSYAKLRRMSRP